MMLMENVELRMRNGRDKEERKIGVWALAQVADRHHPVLLISSIPHS